MTKKTKVVVSLCTLGLAFGAIAATAVHSFSRFALATYDDRQPYTGVVTVYASDFSNGSGSITKNGNTFNYSGVTVDGEIISIASGGSLSAAQNSGATSGATLMGAGFSKIGMTAASNFTAQVALNGVSTPIMLSADQYAEMPVNSKEFNFEITTGPVVAKSFAVMFECKSSEIVIDGLANEYIWDTEVMSNKVTVAANANNTTDIYATKRQDGIYLFANQHVDTKKNAGDAWWQHDNIEFRFGNQNSAILTDRRSDGLPYEGQVWLSALKTSSITAGSFAVTDFTDNPGGGYDISYEAFLSWQELRNHLYDLRYEDSIIFVAGIAYQAGWANTERWSDEQTNLEMYKEIKTKGIEQFSYANVNDGGEEITTVNKNRFDSDAWFNLGCETLRMNGNASWTLKAEFISTNTTPTAVGDGLALEICSPGWSNGGWSYRKDWWGWGGWNNTGGEGNAGPHDSSSVGDDWSAAMSNMNVKARFAFNSVSGYITYSAVCTSNVEGYVGKKIYVTFFTKKIDYRGEMQVKFGASFGSIQLLEVDLVRGALME